MRWAVLLLLAGCGGSGSGGATDGGGGPNTVAGKVQGHQWSQVGAAYWIGMPSAPPPAAFVFLLEAPTPCAAISTPNWDKIIGNEQVLEIEVRDPAVATLQVPAQAAAAYLRGDYNPSAESGTVTLTSIVPGKSLAGSFDARFAGEALRGTFEAVYCPSGVEP
jgi:hypothetical protein